MTASEVRTTPSRGSFVVAGCVTGDDWHVDAMSVTFPFRTPVVGVSFHQDAVRAVAAGADVVVVHQPDNPYDVNAMEVVADNGDHLGYLPAALAARLVAGVGVGARLAAVVDLTYGADICALRLLVTGRHTDQVRVPAAPEEDAGDTATSAPDGVTAQRPDRKSRNRRSRASTPSQTGPATSGHGRGAGVTALIDDRPTYATSTGETCNPDVEAAHVPAVTAPLVRTRSGRVLGRLAWKHGSNVHVATGTGEVAYPVALVTVDGEHE
jgi:hypothetical protein